MQPIHVFPIWQVRHAPVRIWQVGAVQLELTRTAASRDQTCAAVKTLEQLAALGFEFRQVPNDVVDREVPMRAWRSAGVWESLPRFPSDAAKAAHAAGGGCGSAAWFPCSPMGAAYRNDFTGFSTNLIARRRAGARAQPPPWPELKCS